MLDLSTEDLRSLINQGYLAFQDYAVAYWYSHVRAMIDHSAELVERGWLGLEPQLLNLDGDLGECIACALSDFIDNYNEITKDESDEGPIEIRSPSLEAVRSCDFAFDLQRLMTHRSDFERSNKDWKDKISLQSLTAALSVNRTTLQAMGSESAASVSRRQVLTQYYGSNWFKCSKVSCRWFHEGFADGRSLKKHEDRHNRPYRCPEEECESMDANFATAQDLKNHNHKFHPQILDESESFPTIEKPEVPPTKWKCGVCGKYFGRGTILRGHMRRHTGERPFECSRCGRAFKLKNDCRRHENICQRAEVRRVQR